jgi:hypothetical protein
MSAAVIGILAIGGLALAALGFVLRRADRLHDVARREQP